MTRQDFSFPPTSDPFILSCREGDTKAIRAYLQSNSISLKKINSGLSQSCLFNQPEVAQYLTCSPELILHADINHDNFWALGFASLHGHVKILDFFFSTQDLVHPLKIDNSSLNYFSNLILKSCEKGHIPVIDFLTHCTYKDYFMDKINYGFCKSCEKGHLDVVTYFLNSPSSFAYISKDKMKSSGLIEAIEHNQFHILKYIVLESKLYNLKELKTIHEQLFKVYGHENSYMDFEKLIKAYELHLSLNQKHVSNLKVKI